MSSFDNAVRTLQITARLTHGQDDSTRKESFESVRDDISNKDLLRMASSYESELLEYMWYMVINKIADHTDNKMARDKALRDKLADEKKTDTSSDTTSIDTTKSDNPFELFKKTKKNWGDYSSTDEDVPEPKPAKAKAPKASGPWATVASSPFPPLQRGASHNTQGARNMPTGRAPKHDKSDKASEYSTPSNWKSDRTKHSSSELYVFGVYTASELKDTNVRDRDWFLWETDDQGNPIGWRKPNGWYTSRPKALFRHKKSNTGDEWIHQTYESDTKSWITKDHKTYVMMMRADTNHLN
jgi:hypothetical protein